MELNEIVCLVFGNWTTLHFSMLILYRKPFLEAVASFMGSSVKPAAFYPPLFV